MTDAATESSAARAEVVELGRGLRSVTAVTLFTICSLMALVGLVGVCCMMPGGIDQPLFWQGIAGAVIAVLAIPTVSAKWRRSRHWWLLVPFAIAATWLAVELAAAWVTGSFAGQPTSGIPYLLVPLAVCTTYVWVRLGSSMRSTETPSPNV